MHILGLGFLFIIQSSITLASNGDSSKFYKTCVKSCMTENCEEGGGFTKEASLKQDKWSRMLFWGCQDECRYHCMWRTVDGFKERGYTTPKFHGKWPFIRIRGVQEPASALFSLMNLAVHVYMHSKIRKEFRGENVPMLRFWHCFVAVCVNAWAWSTIFHTRDTPFTEFMDYACALSMIMALFVGGALRLFRHRRLTSWLILLVTALYYLKHVRYLYTGQIDYDYNMMININLGVYGAVIWMVFSLWHYRLGHLYEWRLSLFLLLSAASTVLETADFPPLYSMLDAHALWHLTTAPLPLLFYRFVIDDLKYLRRTEVYEKISTKRS